MSSAWDIGYRYPMSSPNDIVDATSENVPELVLENSLKGPVFVICGTPGGHPE